VSGADWLPQCSSSEINGRFFCFGCVDGVVQANKVYRIAEVAKQLCVPAGFPRAQLTDIVVGHLRRNPQRQQLPFAQIIVEALSTGFPCQP
jgi:Rap1a immunity proteins